MGTFFDFISGLSHESIGLALNGLWFGAALTGLSWLTWRLFRKSNATTGYVIWWLVLAAVFVSPLAISGPAADWLKSRFAHQATMTAVAVPSTELSPEVRRQAPSDPRMDNDREHAATKSASPYRIAEPATDQSGQAVISGGVDVISRDDDGATLSLAVRLLPVSLFGLWLCILLFLLARLALARRKMSAIKYGSIPYDTSHFVALRRVMSHGTRRSVEVRVSSGIDFPMAAGLGKPVVLLPHKVVHQLSEREIEALIIHEVAHLLRWDDWTKLGQKIIEAVLFFNPVVHWIGRRLDLEREIACDDRVVEHLGRPGEYARCLTRLTRLAALPAGASLIPGVLTSRKQIFQRFDRLLSGRHDSSTRFSRAVFLSVFIVIMTGLAVALRVVPVVAVPMEAVTFAELSTELQTIGKGILIDVVGREQGHEGALAGNVNDQLDVVIGPPAQFLPSADIISTADVRVNASTNLMDKDAGSPDPVLDNSAYDKQLYAAVLDDDKVRKSPERAAERPVDWNDEIFKLPISGTIHGHGRNADAIQVWIDEKQEVRAAMQGRIALAADGGSVESISKGGYLAIREQHGSIWRELDITPTEGGRLVYAYYIDGTPREFDINAGKWLARVLRAMSPDLKMIRGGVTTVYFDLAEAREALDAADIAEPLEEREPAEPLEPLEELEPLEPRPEDEGLLSRIFDWAGDPFEDFGEGLMITHEDDDDALDIFRFDGRQKIRIRMDGKVTFADDDRTITGISPDGYFAIWEEDGGRHRELDVKPGPGGTLQFGYLEDGDTQEFGAEEQEWLGAVLLKMFREMGINADKRARRIYEREGVAGVLKEIAAIDSDYAKRQYFDALLDSDELSDADYSTMLGQIERELESDYEKAQLLVDMADRVSRNKALIRDYVAVVQTIDSDYETRRVLSAMSMGDEVDDDVLLAVLEIAGGMDSDYEKAELLIDMAPYCRGRRDFQEVYITAIINLESDYETRRVLSALSLDQDTDPEILLDVLKIAGQMGSDYEKAELLIELAPHCRENAHLQAEYVNAINNLESDYETRRVLDALSMGVDVDPQILVSVLEIINGMDSDYEKAELLVDIGKRNRAYERARETYAAARDSGRDLDYELARQAYITAVSNIGSDYETKRVLTTLIERGELSDSLVMDILSVTAGISSDYEKSEVLKLLVDYCRGNEGLEQAFFDIVDSMSSDYEIKELYTLMYRDARGSGAKYK